LTLLPSHLSAHLFPYTTLFRSWRPVCASTPGRASRPETGEYPRDSRGPREAARFWHRQDAEPRRCFARAGPYPDAVAADDTGIRSEEHTSELQSQSNLVCRLLL